MPVKLPKQPIPFPLKGLHEGMGYDYQPPLTSTNEVNVRSFDALSGRLRGGRRSGLDKYLSVTVSGDHPIQEMKKVVQTASSEDPTSGTPETIVETFSSFTNGATTVDWLGRYVPVRPSCTASVTFTRTGAAHTGKASGPHRALFIAASIENQPSRCLMVPFATTNVIDTTWTAQTQAATNHFDHCQVFARVSPTFSSYYRARLNKIGSAAFVRITKRVAGGAETTLATSATIPLTDTLVEATDLRMVLDASASSGLITATAYWPSKNSDSATWTTGLSTSATDTSGQENTSVAFGWLDINGSVSSGASACLAATYTRYIPVTSTPLITVSGTDTTSPTPSRYFVPAGITAFDLTPLTSLRVLTSQIGPSSQSGDPAWCSVDTTSATLEGNSGSTRITAFTPTPAPATGIEYAIETKANAGTNDKIVFCTRVTENFLNMVVVELTSVVDGGASITDFFSTVSVVAIVNGVRTVLDSFTYGSGGTNPPSPYIGDSSTWMRWTDDSDTIRLKINGLTLFEYTPSDSASWTGAMATAISGTRVAAGIQSSAANSVRFLSNPGLSSAGVFTSALMVASNGDVKKIQSGVLSTPTGGTGALTTEQHRVVFQPGYQRLFMIDGTRSKYYRFDLDTIRDWATDVTDGTLPEGCRLMCLWRGRMVLAGQLDDPQNWFMSRLGDPFDWDYAPADTSATDPVAGNLSEAGLVGDIITALIPYSDDVLIIGGDHTIWKMEGDPAAGGTVVQLSDQTGIAWGRAWAKDPEGVLYFVGTDGIYKLTENSLVNMTAEVMPRRFSAIDISQYQAHMAWDYFRHALIVQFVSRTDGEENVSFVWEKRIDAWHPDVYDAEIGPSCMLAYDGAGANDKEMLFGCMDGYIRKIDDDFLDDDGGDIGSLVRYPMLLAADHASEVVVAHILPVLANNSDSVNLKVYTGQSAEDCALAAAPRYVRTLPHGGRVQSVRQKIRGYAVQLEISNAGADAWAMEGITVEFDASGLPRREVKGD